MHRLLFLLLALQLPLLAQACVPDGSPESGSDCWVIEVADQTGWRSLPAAEAAEAILKALGGRADRRVQITGYAEAGGSLSLGLARVQARVDELRRALLQRAGKLRLAIDSALLVAPADSRPDRSGRVVVRIR